MKEDIDTSTSKITELEEKLGKLYFLIYPEDETEVLRLRTQKKPLLCHIPFRACHVWSKSKNGISYCLKCGKVDFYVGVTGVLRYHREKEES